MKRRWPIWLSLVVLMLALDAASFASWWTGSPTRVSTEGGKTVRVVELHMTPFRYHTIYLWIPGILFMEYVCGWRQVAELAAYQDSIYVYAK
jgi:hypothetical protein